MKGRTSSTSTYKPIHTCTICQVPSAFAMCLYLFRADFLNLALCAYNILLSRRLFANAFRAPRLLESPFLSAFTPVLKSSIGSPNWSSQDLFCQYIKVQSPSLLRTGNSYYLKSQLQLSSTRMKSSS